MGHAHCTLGLLPVAPPSDRSSVLEHLPAACSSGPISWRSCRQWNRTASFRTSRQQLVDTMPTLFSRLPKCSPKSEARRNDQGQDKVKNFTVQKRAIDSKTVVFGCQSFAHHLRAGSQV